MNNFYSMVHDLSFNHYNVSIERYRTRINSELIFFQKKNNFFKDKIVLDIGTGFQSIVALKFGAKQVYHIDFNKNQITNIKKIQKKLKIKTQIKSFYFDLNKDNFNKIPKFDIGIIFGIINHVNKPHDVLIKLKKRLKVNGELLVRAYNGKSITRKIINDLRVYKSTSNLSQIKNIYLKKFGSKIEKSFHFRDMIDDLYFDIVKDFNLKKSMKQYYSNLKSDENLRFIIKHTSKNNDIKKNLIIMSNESKKFIPTKFDLDFVVNSYILIRNFKYIDKNEEVKLLKTSYTKNDFFKLIKFYLLKFKRIFKCKLSMLI